MPNRYRNELDHPVEVVGVITLVSTRDPPAADCTRRCVNADVGPPTYGRAMPSLDVLPKIGAPATRALQGAEYTKLGQLAGVPRSELANLHGMGPKALGVIEASPNEHGLELA